MGEIKMSSRVFQSSSLKLEHMFLHTLLSVEVISWQRLCSIVDASSSEQYIFSINSKTLFDTYNEIYYVERRIC